jgi:regulator of nucleoside diphosphate kinase
MESAMLSTRPTQTNDQARTPRQRPPITIATDDYEKLQRVIDANSVGRHADLADALDEELSRATVVDPSAVPPDIVTMQSSCVFRFEDTGEEREVTLVYPQQADVARGRVSVLAPVGAALLGLATGDSITWNTPNGPRRIAVVRVRRAKPRPAVTRRRGRLSRVNVSGSGSGRRQPPGGPTMTARWTRQSSSAVTTTSSAPNAAQRPT